MKFKDSRFVDSIASSSVNLKVLNKIPLYGDKKNGAQSRASTKSLFRNDLIVSWHSGAFRHFGWELNWEQKTIFSRAFFRFRV